MLSTDLKHMALCFWTKGTFHLSTENPFASQDANVQAARSTKSLHRATALLYHLIASPHPTVVPQDAALVTMPSYLIHPAPMAQ